MEGFRPVLRRAAASPRVVRLVCALLVLASVLGPPSPARAWTTKVAGEVGEYDEAPLLARDPAGDLLAAVPGFLANVTKYDGESGALLWHVDGPGDDASYNSSIAVDPRGDALVGLSPVAAVVKLSGADGHTLWRYQDDSGLRYPLPLLVDGNGDALFVADAGNEVVVTKVSGTSGARLWRTKPVASGSFNTTTAAAIDLRGDVVIGTRSYEPGSSHSVILKVSGTDGRLLWSTTLDGESYLAGVAFDASGDVLAGGTLFAGLDPLSVALAVKLDGATGAVRWRDATLPGAASAIAVDPADGLVVAGTDFVGSVVTHWNADGVRTWSRPVGSPDREQNVDRVVAVEGRIVVGGSVRSSPTLAGFAVHGLDAADGSDVWQIERQSDGPLVRLSGFGGTTALVPDGAGGVVVSAWFLDADSFTAAVLTNVALADGRERWAVDFDTSSRGISDGAVSLELDPQGDLVAGGILASAESGLRAAAVKLSREDGHVLWQSVVDAMHGSGRAVVDPAGDVFVPGTVKTGPLAPYGSVASTEMGPQPRAPDRLAAVKLSGADGHELWRWIESGSDGHSIMGRTAVDSRGNLLANVWKKSTGGPQVVKLDGANGTPTWFGPTAAVSIFSEAVQERAPLVIDGADDVVAAANDSLFGSREAAVVKLDGTDGARRWSAPMPDGVGATVLALDAHGDAIVGASSFYPPTGFSESRVVQKLVGETGAVVWTRELGPGDFNDVAIDGAGDVIVAGWAGGLRDAGTLSVIKLDGETGSLVWSSRAFAGTPGIANAVTLNAAGDVFVAARLVAVGNARFAILALRGTDGALRWTRVHPSGDDSEARAIVLDGTGRVVGAGSLFGSEETLLDFAVVSLDAATGRDDACGSQRSCGFGPTLRVPTSGRGRLPLR